MAIALDASSSAVGTGSTTTLSHTTSGTNRLLFVSVYEATNAVNCTGVTYNGVAMTKITQLILTDRAASFWYLVAPATGANTVAITGVGAYTIVLMAESFTGAKQTGVPDSSNTGSTASATTFSVSTTTVADNCWLVGHLFNSTTNGMTAGTGTTFRQQPAGGSLAIGDSNGAKTPAGSYSLALNADVSANCGIIIASFAPVVTNNSFLAFM